MTRIVAMFVFAAVLLSACGGSADTPVALSTAPTATSSASSHASSPTNMANYRFPPHAKVLDISAVFTRYAVDNQTVGDVKKYWKSYFHAIGFKKYDKRNSAMFFVEDHTRIAVTYVQFGADVHGTFKILTR